ncbi:hypothetical protein HYH03_014941 [Edaphochlamys debaryana]|uniref:Uncharacterized protein n=1 Tax=Edaphochlamys debaryana TaxID=47281 RepID=A0A835XMU8_9CHLO|nr:hypothetical protein HYH03_014941 [Edaphochlamys debaryana]|eukprot:KAG2486360.1 hypothetical protein HYH03_014941 [Edaphochlamys debaryana]
MTTIKIQGVEPSQLSPGYEQRLRGLVAARGAGRRLAGVYVRGGCVELVLQLEGLGEGWAPPGAEEAGEEGAEGPGLGGAGGLGEGDEGEQAGESWGSGIDSLGVSSTAGEQAGDAAAPASGHGSGPSFSPPRSLCFGAPLPGALGQPRLGRRGGGAGGRGLPAAASEPHAGSLPSGHPLPPGDPVQLPALGARTRGGSGARAFSLSSGAGGVQGREARQALGLRAGPAEAAAASGGDWGLGLGLGSVGLGSGCAAGGSGPGPHDAAAEPLGLGLGLGLGLELLLRSARSLGSGGSASGLGSGEAGAGAVAELGLSALRAGGPAGSALLGPS